MHPQKNQSSDLSLYIFWFLVNWLEEFPLETLEKKTPPLKKIAQTKIQGMLTLLRSKNAELQKSYPTYTSLGLNQHWLSLDLASPESVQTTLQAYRHVESPDFFANFSSEERRLLGPNSKFILASRLQF